MVNHSAAVSVALLLLPALLLVAPAQADDRAPVLLRKTPLLTPNEAAGTGLAPEVKVRVKVDARGRVAGVEVRGIEPASDFDELFTKETITNISRWRFAPAIVEGQASETTLEWSVKFNPLHDRDCKTAKDKTETLWLPLGFPDHSEARRARVLGLPPKQRQELLAGKVRVAEQFLDPEYRHRFSSPRFVVLSDARKPETTEILASNLEAIFNVLDAMFHPAIEPQPLKTKIVVYLYESRDSLLALRSELDLCEAGFTYYSSAGLLAFPLEMPSSNSLMAVILHAACHAYVDRQVVRPSYSLPLWLGEGFAQYLGRSSIRRRKLIPGRTQNVELVLLTPVWPFSQGPAWFRVRTRERLAVDDVRRRIVRGEAQSIEQLMTADYLTFYANKRALYLPMSWLLVHFLRHGEPEWEEGKFATFMLYVAEGYPATAALEAVYGVPPDGIEERFRRYVKKF